MIVLTATTAAKLRRRNRARPAQQAAYESLKARLAGASFWREGGIEPGLRYEDFRARVPLRGHEQFAPAIARMQAGETDVLWPGACVFFAATAGTTTRRSRLVPVTAEMLAHFREATRDALLYYTARVGHAGVFSGRHLYLAGSTALVSLPRDGSGAFASDLGGIITLSLSPTADRHLLEPGTAISQLAEGRAKFEAIASRVTRADISLIAGLPNWVLSFAHALGESAAYHKTQIANLQALWPNLECLLHAGAPLGPYQHELRAALGPAVKFH